MSKKKPTMREQIADLEADLAGCEATIEELEAKVDAFSVSIDAHREVQEQKDRHIQTLRDERRELEAEVDELRVKARELARAYDEIDHRGAGPDETLIDYIRRVSSSVQIHKGTITKQERSQAELREDVERLETELHHANGLLVRRKTEIDELKAHLSASAREAQSWARTTTSLQDSLEEMHDKYMDLLDMQSRRGLARRAISRLLEVVR